MLRVSGAWRNWAGNVESRPSAVSQVSTLDGVRAVLRAARARGTTVRVAGSGHSFTPLVATDGVLLRVDGLRGVVAVDRDRRRVRVLAGTPLHELNPALQAHGPGPAEPRRHRPPDDQRGGRHRHPRHRQPAAGHRRRGVRPHPGARRRHRARVLRRGRAGRVPGGPGGARGARGGRRARAAVRAGLPPARRRGGGVARRDARATSRRRRTRTTTSTCCGSPTPTG